MDFYCKTLSLLLASGGAAISLSSAEPATTIPADNPIPHQRGWLKQCEDKIAAAQGKQIDILFVGDSITQHFDEQPDNGWTLVGGPVWNQHYAHRKALNLGVGSDGTQHILWRLDHENIKGFKPRVIVFMAGINDLQFPPEDIAAGIKAVLDKLKIMYPNARIVLMAITPNAINQKNADAANEIIKTFADNQTITFLDLAPAMRMPGNRGWTGLGGDHIHFTPEGYKIWATQLDHVLSKLMRP